MIKTTILDGKPIAQAILAQLKQEIEHLPSVPQITTILVGDSPTSKKYIKNKSEQAKKIGIKYSTIKLPSNISTTKLILQITYLNLNPAVNGIIVQLPLAPQLDTELCLNAIDPHKDIDGLHSHNFGSLITGHTELWPATALGVFKLLDYYQLNKLQGKHVVIIGTSNIAGKPIAIMMSQKNATVTLCNEFTPHLTQYTQSADIIISAAGIPNLIDQNMVKPDSICINIGMQIINNKIIGDLDFNSLNGFVKYLTPTLGSTGLLTVVSLLINTLHAYQLQNHLNYDNKQTKML